MADTHRIFIAAPLPAALARGLGEIQRTLTPDHGDAVRWEPIGRIHLTIRFLGETDVGLEPGIAGAMREATRSLSPITAMLGRITGLPDRRQPRVVAVTLTGEIDRLMLLRRRLDEALAALGIDPEPRRYAPHLTIGRLRRQASRRARGDLAKALAVLPVLTGSWRLDQATLFRSELDPAGARHTPLATVQMPS